MSSKPVEKKILHAGRPGAKNPDFREGTKVKFHFVTKLPDGDVVLDDSRKWEGLPGDCMELIFGKKFKMEIWETCLSTMVEGEVASFKVKKRMTCNYPTVAKTLRDSFDPRRNKNNAKRHQHMCGMMAMQMQGGLGYDDLNELFREPSDLEFIMEVISIEEPESYKKETWQMDAQEKLDSIPKLREEGNSLYRQNRTEEASQKYFQAIGMLEQLMLREKPNDEEWLSLRAKKLPLLLNYSQCKLCESDFYQVIERCTEVLEADSDNIKALFRRAKAHVGAWNPREAKSDFQRVMELDSTLAATCRKEIKLVEELEKKKNEEDKQKLTNMF